MVKRCVFVGTFVAAVCLAAAPDLAADPISFRFTVLVEESGGPIPEVLGAPITAGDIVTGSVTFDSEAQDLGAAFPTIGSFESSGDPFGIALDVGDTPRMNDRAFVQIHTQGPFARLQFGADAGLKGFDAFVSLVLGDPTGTALSSDALPRRAPDLNLFGRRTFRFSAAPAGVDDRDVPPGGFAQFAGQVTSLTDTQPIPEPGTLVLFTSAAVVLARRRWKRAE